MDLHNPIWKLFKGSPWPLGKDHGLQGPWYSGLWPSLQPCCPHPWHSSCALATKTLQGPLYILLCFCCLDHSLSLCPSRCHLLCEAFHVLSLCMPSALCTDWYYMALLLWTMMCLSPYMLSLLDWELLEGKNCVLFSSVAPALSMGFSSLKTWDGGVAYNQIVKAGGSRAAWVASVQKQSFQWFFSKCASYISAWERIWGDTKTVSILIVIYVLMYVLNVLSTTLLLFLLSLLK